MTKINYEFIQKIFNRKIELKKEKDKITLSKYSDYIPMYDIYSDSIYPISNLNVYYRLIDCHYRFITSEVKQWIENKLKKESNESKKNLYIKNLAIIDNYHLDTLEKTSYQTLYKYGPELGLSISICKRNSFHPYSRHLTPYYTKNELIKLGVNNKIISKISPENLVDKDLHYKICKTVSKNDVSSKLIMKHMKHIIKNKCISWISFYSMTGSYIFNNYLRNLETTIIAEYMKKGIEKITSTISSIDSMDDDYYFYRFVWDDNFLRKLSIGDKFIDNGFISTTRDPFYAPGMNLDFGLVLIKINVPKHMKGVGLFMENFSLFPKEEEFILCPNSKLELIAKDDNFTYEHINKIFMNHITKKYEFNLISNDTSFINNLKYISDENIPTIDLETIQLYGRDRIDLFYSLIENCDEMEQFKYKGAIYQCIIFDSTTSYSKLYHNKVKEGLMITKYKDGYPQLSIECGEELVVNFQQTFTPYDELLKQDESIDSILGHIGKIFGYEKAKVYTQYYNFTEFSDNYNDDESKLYLYTYMFCNTIYRYYKNNVKEYKSNLFKSKFGYWNLDKIGREIVPDEIVTKLPKEYKDSKLTWKDLFIIITEKHFYMYPRLESWMNYHHNNIIKNIYFEFDVLTYLSNNGYDTYQLPIIMESVDRRKNKKLGLIFNKNIRRTD